MGLKSGLLLLVGAIVTIIYLIRQRLGKHWGISNPLEEEDVRGRTVIVTGSSSGIGQKIVTELAKRHARVIVTARSLEKARQTVVDIRQNTFYGEVIPMKLDLGSIQSIKEFYHEIIQSFDTIDILINNAGVLEPIKEGAPLKRTEDGYEIQFGVNHLGHFLLTNLLLPLLKNAENSRIIVVASGVYKKAQLNFEDLNWDEESPPKAKEFGDFPLYNMSKLANILFAKELAKRLEGTGVHVYSLCPGLVMTNISRHIQIPLVYVISQVPFAALTAKTAWQGCQTVLYCALSKKCAYESGLMYRNCDLWTSDKYYFPDDILMKAPPNHDDKVLLSDFNALRLWDESEKCLQMKFPVV